MNRKKEYLPTWTYPNKNIIIVIKCTIIGLFFLIYVTTLETNQ